MELITGVAARSPESPRMSLLPSAMLDATVVLPRLFPRNIVGERERGMPLEI